MHQPPAEVVIIMFGGVRQLAKKLRRSHSSIVRWHLPVDEGGTGGRIPSKAVGELLALAQMEGKRLSPIDLVVGREV